MAYRPKGKTQKDKIPEGNIGETDFRGTRTAERKCMGYRETLEMAVLVIFIKGFYWYTHMLKYQTVNFKYGQFNVCQLYSVRWRKKVSEKLFQKFKVYRVLLLSILFLLVNVPLPVNVYTKLMVKVLYKYKSGQGD